MATCKTYSISSSVVGLSYAIEECPSILPQSPSWTRIEASGFSDFGAQLTIGTRSAGSVVRRTQRGSITGVTASAGFSSDLTPTGGHDWMFALGLRTTPQTRSSSAITAITATTITVENGASFATGNIVRIFGGTKESNNALRAVVSSIAGNVLTVQVLDSNESLQATTETGATLRQVGARFGEGMLALNVTSNTASIRRATGNVNLSTALGLQVGDWIFLGGDSETSQFAGRTGFARVSALSETAIDLDRMTYMPAVDSGAGKRIEIYMPNRVRDPVTTAERAERTVQWERTLGKTGEYESAEYVTGAALDSMKISMPSDSNVTLDYTFAASNTEIFGGDKALKNGTRTTVTKGAPYSTATDTVRTHISRNDAPSPWAQGMFEYVSDVNFTLSNNSTRPAAHRKAGSQYGGLGATLGTLEVSGSLTAYYADSTAVQAVREAAAVSLDTIMVRDGYGLVIDLPLVTLSNAQITVEENQPITLPLDITAAESANGYMMGTYWFGGLPDIARG